MRRATERVEQADVLVVGGGLAGLVAAITAAEQGAGAVTLVDKAWVGKSGQSAFAAGNWALRLPGDDLGTWIEESIVTGDYLNDQAWVKQLWEQNFEVTAVLAGWCDEYGLPNFSRLPSGEYVRRRSRGHIQTWHAMVDSLSLMEALRRRAERQGVTIRDRAMVTDLVLSEGRCRGVVGFGVRDAAPFVIFAPQTVVAAAGTAFKCTYVGHRNLTGDLQAAIWRAGGTFVNMENIAHNTTARAMDVHGMNQYQSVGGKWTNAVGEEFMPAYDPILRNRCNQATMSLALAREVHEGRGPIFFDVTSATAADQALCRDTLPQSFRVWDMAGIDPFREKVEWISSLQGTNESGGGVRIDLRCHTGIPGLLAAGDTTSLPPHGAYCFGGVNLAFAAVSGKVAGETAASELAGEGCPPAGAGHRHGEASLVAGHLLERALRPLTRSGDPETVIETVQQTLVPYRVSLLKSEGALQQARRRLKDLGGAVDSLGARDPHGLMRAHEAANLVTLATLIVEASLFRAESRGFHCRLDHPWVDNVDWLAWVCMRRGEDGEPQLWKEPIPTPLLAPSLSRQRHRSTRAGQEGDGPCP